jgi:hypothetical protein
MSKIAYLLSQNPISSYTVFREEYLVLRSKRGILEAAKNPERQTSERRPSRLREEMGLHPN